MNWKTKILLGFTAFFVCLGIIALIERIFLVGFQFRLVMLVFMYVSLLEYAVKGYRTDPQNRKLKGLMIRYESIVIVMLMRWFAYGFQYMVIITAVCGMCVAYAAGRFEFVKETRKMMIIILALVIAILAGVTIQKKEPVDFFILNTYLSPLYLWSAISATYFIRCKDRVPVTPEGRVSAT